MQAQEVSEVVIAAFQEAEKVNYYVLTPEAFRDMKSDGGVTYLGHHVTAAESAARLTVASCNEAGVERWNPDKVINMLLEYIRNCTLPR